jgi:hypothetical protein
MYVGMYIHIPIPAGGTTARVDICSGGPGYQTKHPSNSMLLDMEGGGCGSAEIGRGELCI